MAKRRNRPPSRPAGLDLVGQHVRIKKVFPAFDWGWKAGVATWRGELQPRELSGWYRIKIVYKLGNVPKVFVTSHKMDPACGHLYPDGSLCLYWPKEWHWMRQASIAETILPWAANWLYFYELWMDTGKWLGPSSHDETAHLKDPNKSNAA